MNALASLRLVCSTIGDQRFALDAAIGAAETELFDLDEKPFGTLQSLVYRKWNAGDLGDQPGPHGHLEVVPNPVKLRTTEAPFTK